MQIGSSNQPYNYYHSMPMMNKQLLFLSPRFDKERAQGGIFSEKLFKRRLQVSKVEVREPTKAF